MRSTWRGSSLADFTVFESRGTVVVSSGRREVSLALSSSRSIFCFEKKKEDTASYNKIGPQVYSLLESLRIRTRPNLDKCIR
jgi:hypothetical protein